MNYHYWCTNLTQLVYFLNISNRRLNAPPPAPTPPHPTLSPGSHPSTPHPLSPAPTPPHPHPLPSSHLALTLHPSLHPGHAMLCDGSVCHTDLRPEGSLRSCPHCPRPRPHACTNRSRRGEQGHSDTDLSKVALKGTEPFLLMWVNTPGIIEMPR